MSLLPILQFSNAHEAFSEIKRRSGGSVQAVDDKTLQAAQAIVDDVRQGGEAAFRKQANRLGDLATPDDKFWFTPDELREAFEGLPESTQALLRRTADQVRKFAGAQKATLTELNTTVPGGRAGHTIAPVKSAGCYAPGGNYPLPSSVIMTACTARVAGVKRVIVASPRPKPITLAAAHVSGADALIAAGGAHAVAALAYGCNIGELGEEGCDIIVGPGNKWVTAAKQIVSGKCAIDMLAGPSECLVLADETADPGVIAADLLAQAEHATDAIPMLVTMDSDLAKKVQDEVSLQLETLTTAATARVACQGGYAIVLPNLEECISMCDSLGGEHLEVMTKNAGEIAKRLDSYGGLFIGAKSAEVFGDYGAGPNHVLPTGGTARYTGGLSVFTFLRIRTWLHLDEELEEQTNGNQNDKKRAREEEFQEQQRLARDAADLARLEGLEGHARAAERRLVDENGDASKSKRTKS